MKKKLAVVIPIVLLIGLGLAYHIIQNMGDLPDLGQYRSLEYFDGEQFVSPSKIEYFPDRITGGETGFKRFIFRSPNAPEKALPKVELTRASFSQPPENFAFYWLGHSSAIVELGHRRLIFDPVLGNASPIPGTARRFDAAPLKREDLPDIDYVIITHDHYDHLEYATMRHLRNRDIKFIVPLGVEAHLLKWGVAPEKIKVLGWGETLSEGDIKITAEKAVHYSGRGSKDKNKSLWVSYIISGRDKKIFWSGDTGYSPHLAEIGEKYGPFDLATVEIDGWNNGWPNIHLFPKEVIQTTQDVKAQILIPLHWGVFDLALHPWDESIIETVRLADEEGVEIMTPLMGQKIIPGQSVTSRWWE